MSLGDFGLQDFFSRDQIKWLEERYGNTFSTSLKGNLYADLPKPWEFSGYFSFKNKNLPFYLANETGQQAMNFGNDIYGIILPYNHGHDGGFYIPMPHKRFLHLFHTGEKDTRVVSDSFEGLEFTQTIHPKCRLVLVREV